MPSSTPSGRRREPAASGRSATIAPMISLRILLALVLASLGLAACGGSSSKSPSKSTSTPTSTTNGVDAKTPTAILADAKHAADAASSVHVAGSIAATGAPTTFDIHLVKGQGGSGSLSVNGLSFDLIRIGSTIFVKGSPAFYRKYGGAAAQLLQGKWLKSSATTGSFASIGPFTELPAFLDNLLTPPAGQPLTKGAAATVAGQQAIQLKDGMGGTLSVATTGTPFPLQIAKGGTSGGTISFDQWNAAVPLTAPAGAVDLNALASQ